MSATVMLVAGEPSGDMHAARLVQELRRLAPGLRYVGMGGSAMRAAGVELLVDAGRLAVVGLVEVLRHWGDIRRALRTLSEHIRREPPALLVLVDYVEFNLRLAREAKAAGVAVLFYISPQVWAWRSHRVKLIGERVDHMAVVFPFEVPFYEAAGIPVTYVGHPLANRVAPSMDLEEARRAFGVDGARPCVALLPGSRRSELRRLLPLLLDSAGELLRRRPDLQFLLPVAPELPEEEVRRAVAARGLPVAVIGPGRVYDVVNVCDAAVTASGTATLEIALLQTPMVIVYKVAPLSYAILRHLIKLPHIGLANIVAGEAVVPELIQHEARPQRVAAEVLRLVEDEAAAARVRQGLARVRRLIGSEDGSRNVARLALAMLEGDGGDARTGAVTGTGPAA